MGIPSIDLGMEWGQKIWGENRLDIMEIEFEGYFIFLVGTLKCLSQHSFIEFLVGGGSMWQCA